MSEEGKPVQIIPDGRGYYDTTTLLTVPGVSLYYPDTMALTADRVYYLPIKVKTPITLDQLDIEVTTQATSGKLARLGLYKANLNLQPTELVGDYGTVAIDAVAVVNKSISQRLEVGRYLLALTTNANVTLRALRCLSPFAGLTPTIGATPVLSTFYVSKTYAAFADPGTAWNTGSAGSYFVVSIFCRVKTP